MLIRSDVLFCKIIAGTQSVNISKKLFPFKALKC